MLCLGFRISFGRYIQKAIDNNKQIWYDKHVQINRYICRNRTAGICFAECFMDCFWQGGERIWNVYRMLGNKKSFSYLLTGKSQSKHFDFYGKDIYRITFFLKEEKYKIHVQEDLWSYLCEVTVNRNPFSKYTQDYLCAGMRILEKGQELQLKTEKL